MAAIDDAIREYSALAKLHQTALTTSSAAVPGGPHNLSMTWNIGARVLDLVSGESGTVIDGKRENVIIPSA